MSEEELKQIHAIINDVWQFMKQFGPGVSDQDEYWDRLIAAGNEIGEKHNRHPLCDLMINGCVWYLEGLTHGQVPTWKQFNFSYRGQWHDSEAVR